MYHSDNLKLEVGPPPPHPYNNPFKIQIQGSHYKDLKIQPLEYIHANNLPFIEGSVVKYITRWREKGGKADLEKIKHFVDLLIHLEGFDK